MAAPSGLFGAMLSKSVVLDRVENTLKLLMPDYLAEAERVTDRDPEALPMIRSWSRAAEFEVWEENQMPRAILLCAGITERGVMEGNGVWRAKWSVNIITVCSGKDKESTEELTGLYGMCIRSILLQCPAMIDGSSRGTEWLDERYTDFPEAQSRSMAGCRQVFSVEFDDVVDSNKGIIAPRVDPYDPPDPLPVVPDVDHVHVTVNKEAIT